MFGSRETEEDHFFPFIHFKDPEVGLSSCGYSFEGDSNVKFGGDPNLSSRRTETLLETTTPKMLIGRLFLLEISQTTKT